GERGDRRGLAAVGHYLVIAAEGLIPVGAEVDVLAFELDVPALLLGTEERLGVMRHIRGPPERRAGRSAQLPRGAWGLAGELFFVASCRTLAVAPVLWHLHFRDLF